MSSPLPVGVLISGWGANLQALMNACALPGFPARIAIVISNNPDARGLRIAKEAGIPAYAINHRDYPDRLAFEAAVDAMLREAEVELVCLAGFMRLLTEQFVNSWPDKLVNVHPSLLPLYKGMDTHKRAIADGQEYAGCTIHFVRPAMDDGPIIVQGRVKILPGDTPNALSTRVLEKELLCFPLALKLIAEGRVTVKDEKVVISGELPKEDWLLIGN
ncbi:MAG: phosphoribosylglycinamide formyltransferase [Alphaproteobacteria bacterium]|nr:phosphoribosylglycinamide formyltransferase [Alphaproteobacteria bacterium]